MMLEGSSASTTISLFAAAESSFEFLHFECVFLGSPIPPTSLTVVNE